MFFKLNALAQRRSSYVSKDPYALLHGRHWWGRGRARIVKRPEPRRKNTLHPFREMGEGSARTKGNSSARPNLHCRARGVPSNPRYDCRRSALGKAAPVDGPKCPLVKEIRGCKNILPECIHLFHSIEAQCEERLKSGGQLLQETMGGKGQNSRALFSPYPLHCIKDGIFLRLTLQRNLTYFILGRSRGVACAH